MSTIEDTVSVQLSEYLVERKALIAHERELRHGRRDCLLRFSGIALDFELTSFAGYRLRIPPTPFAHGQKSRSNR